MTAELDSKALDAAMHSVHGHYADETGDDAAMLWITARSLVTAYLAALPAPAVPVATEPVATLDALTLLIADASRLYWGPFDVIGFLTRWRDRYAAPRPREEGT